MEEGHLSDAKGQKVNFRNAIIIMTSNVGADTIKKGPNLGFAFGQNASLEADAAYKDMHKSLTDQLKRTFRPEFMNRVDSIIVFRQLTEENIVRIVDIIMRQVNERLEEHDLRLETTPEASAWLGKTGYDAEFGARPLRRLVQREVEDRLSDAVLSGRFSEGDTIIVDVEDDEIVLRRAEVVNRLSQEDIEALPAI
jgi:ATP-dependent Clp protease ATP-binding subunit ClpC